MSNYPDDVSQASFDRYWSDKLGDPEAEDPEAEDRCTCTDPFCEREHVRVCHYCSQSIPEDDAVWTYFGFAHVECVLNLRRSNEQPKPNND